MSSKFCIFYSLISFLFTFPVNANKEGIFLVKAEIKKPTLLPFFSIIINEHPDGKIELKYNNTDKVLEESLTFIVKISDGMDHPYILKIKDPQSSCNKTTGFKLHTFIDDQQLASEEDSVLSNSGGTHTLYMKSSTITNAGDVCSGHFQLVLEAEV